MGQTKILDFLNTSSRIICGRDTNNDVDFRFMAEAITPDGFTAMVSCQYSVKSRLTVVSDGSWVLRVKETLLVNDVLVIKNYGYTAPTEGGQRKLEKIVENVACLLRRYEDQENKRTSEVNKVMSFLFD